MNFIAFGADRLNMEINTGIIANPVVPMESVLTESQTQATELAEKLMKLNAMQQVDISQLSYMGNIIDMYV